VQRSDRINTQILDGAIGGNIVVETRDYPKGNVEIACPLYQVHHMLWLTLFCDYNLVYKP
jgi:hypothetical protein